MVVFFLIVIEVNRFDKPEDNGLGMFVPYIPGPLSSIAF